MAGIVGASLCLLGPDRAMGWSEGGHRLVANIAYEQLSPMERKEIVSSFASMRTLRRDSPTA